MSALPRRGFLGAAGALAAWGAALPARAHGPAPSAASAAGATSAASPEAEARASAFRDKHVAAVRAAVVDYEGEPSFVFAALTRRPGP